MQHHEYHDDDLVTEAIAAKITGLSPAWFQRDRYQGATIPYVRIAPRAVRYRVGTLRAEIRRRTVAASSAV